MTPIEVSLLPLLQTGRFGPVTLGSTVAEVRARLGEPDFEHVSDTASGILSFGDMEVHYQGGRVSLFWNDHIPFPGEPSGAVALDAWLFSNGAMPDREQIEASLRAHGVAATWVDIPSTSVADDWDTSVDVPSLTTGEGFDDDSGIPPSTSRIFSRELGCLLIRGEHHLAQIQINEVVKVLHEPAIPVGKTLVDYVSVAERKSAEEWLRRRIEIARREFLRAPGLVTT